MRIVFVFPLFFLFFFLLLSFWLSRMDSRMFLGLDVFPEIWGGGVLSVADGRAR